MKQWMPILFLATGLMGASGLPAAADGSLTTAIAQQLDIKENAFAKLKSSPEVHEMDVPDRSREVSLSGLIRLASSGEPLLQALAEGGNGNLLGPSQQEGFFGRPAAAKDLSNLVLPDGDFEVLAECKPKACKFKLNQAGIEKAQSINWKSPQAQKQFSEYFKEDLARYVEAFRKDGAKAGIIYDDKPQPFGVAEGAERLRAQMKLWPEKEPRLFAYLERYPKDPPEGIRDQIYWSLKDFGYRPTLSVDLIVVDSSPETPGVKAIFVQQTLYADHYLAARYQIGALLDGPEALGTEGHFLFLTDQILFDDSLGSFKRSLLGRGMRSDLEDRLKAIAKQTEKP